MTTRDYIAVTIAIIVIFFCLLEIIIKKKLLSASVIADRLTEECDKHIGHTITYTNDVTSEDLSPIGKGIVLRNVRTEFGVKIYIRSVFEKGTFPKYICIEQILECSCE